MRVVVALGGNALLRRGQPLTAENQRTNARAACRALAPVAAEHELVISHGNGPQVGLLALQGAAYAKVEPRRPQRHLVVNTLVTEWNEHEAKATSDVVFALHGDSGWAIQLVGRYYDTLHNDGDAWRSDEATVEPAPFLGVIGMPPPEPGIHSTVPPRRFGGNIDCKLLVAGTTLFLPIPVDGALVSLGDGHGAQGDGEVSGTAIECPIESALVTL